MSTVKELSEVVKFICALASSISEAAADGKITLGDAVHLYKMLQTLPAAVEGLSEISLGDLSDDDIEAISKEVKESLDLPSDSIESAIEGIIDVGLGLYSLVAHFRK